MSKQKLSLFKLAKFTNLEIVMEAQVQSSGANQSRLIEKYKKNKNSIKNQAIALKIAYGFLLSFLVVLPMFTYFQFIDYFTSGSTNVNAGLFAASAVFAIFFSMQIGYLLILGLLNVSALMTGEAFRWFETLPISEKKLNKLGFMTVFRNIDVGLILLALAFPIVMVIITQNFLLFFVSIFIALVNVFFAFSVLIIVAERLSRVFKVQEINSKRATMIRLFTMLSYIILVFSMSLFLNVAISLIIDLFDAASTLENMESLNLILGLIPFPFSPSYILVMCMDPGRFSMLQWGISIIGVLVYGLLTWFLYRKAVKSMRSVTRSSSLEVKSGREEKKEIEIAIKAKSPIIAYIRKDLSIATKDIQMLMFILMPIILPTVMVFSILGSAGTEVVEDFLILWTIVIIYFPIIALMLIAGFLNVEDSGASVLASLPLNPRDQVKAKMILMITIVSISYALPIIIMLFNPALSIYMGLFISWYPIVLMFLLIGFQMKIRLFGRMKYKYVLEEVNAEHKTWKWIFIGFVEFGSCIGFMIMGVILYSFFGMLVMTIVTLALSLGSLTILFVTLNIMFPKELGRRRMIGIRGTLRKYPLLGTVVLLAVYFVFFYVPDLILLPFILLLGLLPILAVIIIETLLTFAIFGFLWLYVVPKGLKLPNDDENFKEFSRSIRLSNWKPILKNMTIGIGVSLITFLSFYIFGNLFGTYTFDLDVIFGEPLYAPGGFGWLLFIIMLIPGVWEEVSFRGVITTLNERKYSKFTVLIIVSILFGLFHFTNLLAGQALVPTILQAFYASTLGMAFGYIIIKTNSLLPGIIAHYLIDSVGQLFLNTTFPDLASYTFFTILGVGICPLILNFLFIWAMTNKKREEVLL